jgi:hypothetical protein
VLRYGRIDDLAPVGLQGLKRPDLIRTHQAAVARDVTRQDRRQTPFHPLSGQKMPLKSEIRPRTSKHVGLLSG